MNEPTVNADEARSHFMTVFQSIENDLVKLSRRLCLGNEDKAQDLVQDTILKAYVAASEGNLVRSTAKAWFMRIMTNLFINEYRRRKKWDAEVDLDTLTSFGEAGPESSRANVRDVPGVTLIAGILDEELERALATLSEPLRLAVTLVDMQGLEYSEAAIILGVPIGTVRSRLARARMQLHDLLQGFAKMRGISQSNPKKQ
jgi:RNA polymerase sigma-70 factor (ECF subfamily)